MNRIIAYLMEQKLLVNLVVALLIAAGVVTLMNLNREAFPDANFDMVSITTLYPGGSPDEIEKLITIPIEKKLREVDGIDKVRSYNIENVSVLAIYLDDDNGDKAAVVQDIKDAVESVDNLPDNAERPEVKELKFDKKMLIDIAVYGTKPGTPYRKIREAAKHLEDFLYEIDGIAEVEKFGYLDREYLVEADPIKLQFYRMGINSVINTLRTRNLDFPGGSLKVGDREYVLRTSGQYRNTDELKNTVVISNDAGFLTRVKDIAKVKDSFEDPTVYERFNGKNAVILMTWKKKSADEIRLVNKVRESLKTYRPLHEKDVKIEIFYDWSRLTKTRISAVISNAITGLILLALILMALLGVRISAIVSVGIPVAFMVSFMGMKANGITLNIISLFGLIMVLGMIVDFSIVVSENSYRYMEMGLSRKDAIKKGVAEVFWPVTITFLCITAAFAPLLFLTGIVGKFIKAIPIVLIICLAASWFVAMFILPTHLNIFARIKKSNREHESDHDEVIIEKGAFGFIQKAYLKILRGVLRFRYLTLVLLLAGFIGSLALAGVVGFVFMPGGGSEKIILKTRLPQETNLEANLREIKKMEGLILKLPKDELEGLRTRVGIDESNGLDPKPGEGTHKSTLTLFLTPDNDRERNAYLIRDQVRGWVLAAQKEGVITKKMKILFNVEENGPPVGKPVNIEIRGKSFDKLAEIAGRYVDKLKTIEGVTDVTLDYEEGKQEYRYFINEVLASQTNVSVLDVATSLNASYQGAVATSVRLGDEDIDIRVRFPEKERKRLRSLDNVSISNNKGGLIPLSMVTDVRKQPGISHINRLNFKRLVQVQANVDTEKITSREVNKMLKKEFADISEKHPSYSVAYGGEQEDTNKSMGEMGILFIFALMIIYLILAVFFNSLILPGVVMSAIPFALVGVILALFAHGQPLSFMSMLGVFSLAGVIVSNTLVLVQFINNQREKGLPLEEALLNAGIMRLRPVILTTGTTVLALFPTIYGLGGKDYFVAPLALSFGYGLIFATFIPLVLIPTFYHIAEDYKGFVSRMFLKFGIKMGGELHSYDN
jgi:multidrug efflux pump subunit AcrB